MNTLPIIQPFLKITIFSLMLSCALSSYASQYEINEQQLGSFVYKAIDNPEKARNQIAGTALLYGLDNIGIGDTVRDSIEVIKENTRYAFGTCGMIKLKTNEIIATSCLPTAGSVELNSNYDFSSVQLQFKWAI